MPIGRRRALIDDGEAELGGCSRRDLGRGLDSGHLEIGPGHGLFLNQALDHLPLAAAVTAVDISAVSTRITRSIIEFFKPGRAVAYVTRDIMDFSAPPDAQGHSGVFTPEDAFVAAANTFTATATGNIDDDATNDVWTITEAGILANTTDDVTA